MSNLELRKDGAVYMTVEMEKLFTLGGVQVFNIPEFDRIVDDKEIIIVVGNGVAIKEPLDIANDLIAMLGLEGRTARYKDSEVTNDPNI